MSFQWLQMRISEEKDRRERESNILERLPIMMDEIRDALQLCAQQYNEAFGDGQIEVRMEGATIVATANDQDPPATITVTAAPALPGIQVAHETYSKDITVGILPGEGTFYKDGEEFLTTEEMTRRILDRALFPKLGD